MELDEFDALNDNKRTEKSLSLLTRKFVSLLLSSKRGILDLKNVSRGKSIKSIKNDRKTHFKIETFSKKLFLFDSICF